jgi:hypothetical protein
VTIRKKTRRIARGTARRGFRASPTVTATISVPMKEKAEVMKVEKKARKL